MHKTFRINSKLLTRWMLIAASMSGLAGCASSPPAWQSTVIPASGPPPLTGSDPWTVASTGASPAIQRTAYQTPQGTQETVRGQDPTAPVGNTWSPGQGSPGLPSGGTFGSPRVAQDPTQYPQGPPAQLGTELIPAPGTQGYFQVPPSELGNLPPTADIDIRVREAQTGRMTIGAAYNSDSGLVGQIIVDERNFDLFRFPRSLGDILDGTAWRGAGQGFRLELIPGNDVQRYLVNFSEPYLLNTPVSFSASGYYFNRRYFDWDEERLGGRLSLGYRLTHDLSISAGTRLENVDISDPRVDTSPELNEVLGSNQLYIGNVTLVHDTRDHPFLASEGSYLELAVQQAFGDSDYSRADIDFRRYFLIYERPDGSGRHTLAFSSKTGFSGAQTPIFENYFAGGFSTLRGFEFRGASPRNGGVIVGGPFQFLNSVEYLFPITSDDMIKGVAFVDFGTVEPSITIDSDNFRVAPGFGFRIHMPVGGAGGAPLAFDFAFPVAKAETDQTQVFSFYLGVLR